MRACCCCGWTTTGAGCCPTTTVEVCCCGGYTDRSSQGTQTRDQAAWPDPTDEQDPANLRETTPTISPDAARHVSAAGPRRRGAARPAPARPAPGRRPGPRVAAGRTRPVARAAARAARPNGRGLHDHGSLRLHDGAHDGSLGLGRGPRLILAVGLGARDVARGISLDARLACRKLAFDRRQGCPSKREAGKRRDVQTEPAKCELKEPAPHGELMLHYVSCSRYRQLYSTSTA